ncbi:hypothetical protein [Nocardia sp.]|uniref:hypothetical protein n=1 Tax=Nocardia sp. TaxID=1821 RepID=UPI0026352EF4|nr:hypothetical protein [Nocardia sp.]
MPIGVVFLVWALHFSSTVVFVMAAVVGGAGAGLGFRSRLTIVVSKSPADRLGQVGSSYLAVACSGLAAPIVGTGVLSLYWSAAAVAAVFSAMIGVCAIGSIAGSKIL